MHQFESDHVHETWPTMIQSIDLIKGPTKASEECNSLYDLDNIAHEEKDHHNIAYQKLTKDLTKWDSADKFGKTSKAPYKIKMA